MKKSSSVYHEVSDKAASSQGLFKTCSEPEGWEADGSPVHCERMLYSAAEVSAMQPADKRTHVEPTVLAAMRRTNELFDAEVIGKRNLDALAGR